MGLLVLSAAVVDQIVTKFTPDELVNVMARVFATLSKGIDDVNIPHRGTIASRNHRTLFMPSRIAPLAGTAIKIVSIPTGTAPKEVQENGLPASTMVIDEVTGSVCAVVNARKLTALRNAASSLLATRVLLSREPKRIVAFGAGAQVFAHLTLFLQFYPSVTSCKIFNRSANARLQTLLHDLRDRHPGVQIEGHALIENSSGEGSEVRQAVVGADIVITATSSTEPLFPSCYVTPGTHLCLIGSYTPTMHEVDTELIRRAGRVVVDYRAGALSEAGELIKAGVRPNEVAELGEIIYTTEEKPCWRAVSEAIDAIQRSGDVTIFKSVGVGIQDVAIADAVVQRAKEHGLGVVIEDYD